MERDKKVYRVTLLGSVVNLLLLVFKFVAGVLGHSAAMIADAVHSLSDFVTDLIVIVFVKISSKPEDADHAYGHGKYETLASCIIGLALIVVGVMMGYNAVVKIVDVVRNGTELASPGIIGPGGRSAQHSAEGVDVPPYQEGRARGGFSGRGGQCLASSQRCAFFRGYGHRNRRCRPAWQ